MHSRSFIPVGQHRPVRAVDRLDLTCGTTQDKQRGGVPAMEAVSISWNHFGLSGPGCRAGRIRPHPWGCGSFSHPGSGDEDRGLFAEEAAGHEVVDQGGIDSGVEVEVELLDRLAGREAGPSVPQVEPALVAADHFVADEQSQEVRVCQCRMINTHLCRSKSYQFEV